MRVAVDRSAATARPAGAVRGRWSFLRKRRQWLLALLCVGSAAWLALYWSAALDAADARLLLSRANTENVEALERALDEFAVLGHEVELQAVASCSPDALEYFRRYLFTLKHLRDVGIVHDRHLLCSTALGPIDSPVRSSAPDFVLPGGLEIYAYRQVRVSARQPTMVLQTQGFNALVDPGLIALLSRRFPITHSWIRAAEGTEEFELFDRPAAAQNLTRDQRCSETYGFCLMAAAGSSLTRHPLRQAGLAVLGGGTGLAAFLFGQMLIWRSRSPRLRLRRAIRNGELRARYQPVVVVPGASLQGFELLARWPSAPEGLESPERFIAEAETQGLIHALTEQLIRTATLELGEILRARPELRLAINISAFELEDRRLEDVLRETFIACGIAPQQIVIELTERSVASPHRDQINRLADQGFRIYIDDLGEGYSSLSYLHHLRLSGVKISRSFTSGLGTDSPKAELVKAMVALARKLSLDVVLEGIEADAGHAAVLELGSIACQGFHYARPMSIKQLKAWMVAETVVSTRLASSL